MRRVNRPSGAAGASAGPTAQPWPVKHTQVLAIALGILLALTPYRFLSWLKPVASLVEVPTGAISAPMVQVGKWLRPGSRRTTDEQLRALQDEVENWKLLHRQQVEQNERLLSQLDDLQRGQVFLERFAVRRLWRPVIGYDSGPGRDFARIRLAPGDGVDLRAVAAAGGTDLLGRVVESSERECLIQLATSPTIGGLEAVAEVEGLAEAPIRLLLEPIGDGTFAGEVSIDPALVGSPDEPQPARGMLVRLDDDAWSPAAQMLVIGVITSAERKDENQRWTVTVSPRYDAFLSGVILRLPESAPAAGVSEPPG